MSAAESVTLLTGADLAQWELADSDEIAPTEYHAVVDDETGATVLEATAAGTAAGYLTQQALPFTERAQIKITYKLIEADNPQDEKTRAGDDFPLRLYFTSRSFPFYRTIVLVHTLQYQTGDLWTSPYDGTIAKFEMYAFAHGTDKLNEWQSVTIPAGQLWQQVFGTEITELDGFGFMVDSDNSGGLMRTRIAEIEYSY